MNNHNSVITLLYQPPAWQDQAACAGENTETFFPERGDSVEVILKAKAICYQCPVRPECLTYAMNNGEKYGVWGGLSVRERQQLRRLQEQGLIA